MDGSTKDRNDVWYSSDGATWTQAVAEAQWEKRDTHCAVVFDNKIWVLGGFSDINNPNVEYFNDVWSSSDGKKWTCATPKAQWAARCFFQTLIFDNKMWVIGGQGGNRDLNDLWYSADGVNWSQATPAAAPWKARCNFQACVFKNKIWVIGGLADDWLNDVWYYEMPVGIEKNGKAASAAAELKVDALRSLSGGPVEIRYALKKAGSIRICVYTCTGREIRILWNGVQRVGAHRLEWNGRDAGEKSVGAGAYFVRFQTGAGEVTRRITGGNY